MPTNPNQTTILRAINQWCEHDLEDCGMTKTRYDNCRCRQQAHSVVEALEPQKFKNEVVGPRDCCTEKPPSPDFRKMSRAALLTYMGDDASKWAEAFCAINTEKGNMAIDEHWVAGWFAAAIEHSAEVRHLRGQPDLRLAPHNLR